MLTSIQVQNFKAVADSGPVALTPLTVFVGHNGTGKSSLIEALELLQQHTLRGLDAALEPWYGFQHVLWQGVERRKVGKSPFLSHPLAVKVTGRFIEGKRRGPVWRMEWKVGQLAEEAAGLPAQAVATMEETFRLAGHHLHRRRFGMAAEGFDVKERRGREFSDAPGRSLFAAEVPHRCDKWLFLTLDPWAIGQPRRRTLRRSDEPMDKSGSNLSDILHSFLQKDRAGFDAMVDALSYILPYAADVRPEVVRDLVETRSLFRLTEAFGESRRAPLPGWVLSGGTLRLLALMAALRHPDGPEVLFIEELENGLDPRAIGFVMEEIREAVQSGGKQVIVTTHSPYLLDKVSLNHVVTVDRQPGKPPMFVRPDKNKQLQKWAEKFAPGSLYTMGLLSQGGAKP